MTYAEFVEFITPLAVLRGEVKDEPTWRLYHSALMAAPAPSRLLLERARIRAANRRFFPTTEELRADAELERQTVLKLTPYVRCAECQDNCGWIVELQHGVTRMRKCDCWTRYLRTLEEHGVGHEPVFVPDSRLLAAGEAT